MLRISLICLAAVVAVASGSYRRVCYHTNWSQYRTSPAKFYPENIDPQLCTHIIYAFAKLQGNHLKAFEWNDESTPWMKGMYERFTNLKQQNPNLKMSLAVGGWNMGSAPFTAMVATDQSRRDFATDTVKFLRDHGFDGLDLDWEYPANRGSPAGDRQKYTELVKTIQQEFEAEAQTSGKDKLILSAAVAAGKDKIDTAYDVPEVSKYLDMINLMTYDLHGAFEDHTGENSPLHGMSTETGDDVYLNVEFAANYWVQKGAPKAKINIGMPLYGHSFTLQTAANNDLNAPIRGAGNAGRYTNEKGMLAYYEICKMYSTYTKHMDTEQEVPYLVKGDQWVGYDDQESLKKKVDFVKESGFGGVMVWSLALDDFSGSCGEGKYPLMNAIVRELGAPGPSTQSPPVTAVPATNAPVTNPPMTNPPMTNPPITNAPATNAPITNPPMTNPPMTNPPMTNAPATNAPMTNPPMTNPPMTNPPMTNAPMTNAPATNAPMTNPPMTNAPMTNAPATNPPMTNPPMTNPPMTNPPMTNAPAVTNPPAVTNAPVMTNAPVTNAPMTNAPTQNQHATTQLPHHTLKPSIAFNCLGRTTGFYPSPLSCKAYYICAAGRTYEVDCTAGLLFNPLTLYCDYPANVQCTANPPTQGPATQKPATQAPMTQRPITQAPWTPIPTTRAPVQTQAPQTQPPQTQAPQTQAPPINNPAAHFCDGKAEGHHPDPTDCTTFHECASGLHFIQRCAAGTVYNEYSQGCDYPANVPQSNSHTFCSSRKNGYYLDPKDCGFFYQCAYGLSFHEPCPPGLAFNEKVHVCDYPNNVPNCRNYNTR